MPPKKDFLAKAKASVHSKTVKLDALGMTVVVRGLSVGQMDAVSKACLLPGKSEEDGEGAFDNRKLILHVVAASTFDESGDRLIPEGREEELFDLPRSIYAPLQSAALEVNGMSTSAEGNA